MSDPLTPPAFEAARGLLAAAVVFGESAPETFTAIEGLPRDAWPSRDLGILAEAITAIRSEGRRVTAAAVAEEVEGRIDHAAERIADIVSGAATVTPTWAAGQLRVGATPGK